MTVLRPILCWSVLASCGDERYAVPAKPTEGEGCLHVGDVCTIASDDERAGLEFAYGDLEIPAAQARFDWLEDVAVGVEGVFALDHLRLYSVSGGVVRALTGTAGSASGPLLVACQSTGIMEADLYMEDIYFTRAFHVTSSPRGADSLVITDNAAGCGYLARLNPDDGVVTFPVGWEEDADPVLASVQARWGVAEDDAGVVYVVGAHAIYAIYSDQTAEIVAGDGVPGYADGPAATSQINPGSLGVPPVGGGLAWRDGQLYFADSINSLVRRVDLEAGMVSTLAGIPPGGVAVRELVGLDGPEPVEGLALGLVWDVAVGPAGEVYVSVHDQNCIVVVRDGRVEPVAGRCGEEPGFAGDGGPATEALLTSVRGLDVSPDGAWLYFVDDVVVRAVKLAEGPPSPAVAQ